ncbi:hypothetical protein B7463_g12149, partial [Scytalidium lignicola]
MEQHKSENNDVHGINHDDIPHILPISGNVGNAPIESNSLVPALRNRGDTEDSHSQDDKIPNNSQKTENTNREYPSEDAEGELARFDWREFEARYTAALKEADDVENKLVEQLKTRTRFVQLQEETLEEKKAHFNEVVHAFQKAMELLKRR